MLLQTPKKTNMRRHLITLSAVVALLMVIYGHNNQAFAQYNDPQAAELLEEARQKHEASIRNIDDYVVEYEHHTVSYIKRHDNGRPYMAVHSERDYEEGFEAAADADNSDLFAPETFEKLQERARYLGTEEIDGYEVHVIFVEELEDFIPAEEEEMHEAVEEMRIYFDVDDFLLRKMSFKVQAQIEDEIRVIEPVMYFRDYREFEGMPVAFEHLTIVSGISDMISDEDRAEIEAAFEEMERELEQMPEQQRQMVEQMMAGQMGEMKEMLESDQWEHVMRVKNVQVNVGLE